uniref:Kinesin light chain n=1 Tax=Helicotheca tamesis TaxID=374047 RepID=A0A7S2GS08_9STRA|mmetsp:Transcript_10758/g.15015  ORF Transcript_10758/g.15015 Transcript_10758/m.15015 type:complete len:176 (+) Transcript_10758:68-595(+)
MMEEERMCASNMQDTNQTVRTKPDIATKFERELTARICALGEDHPAVAETLNALGLICHHMINDQEKALGCHTRALRIFQLQKREAYPYTDVALTLSDIANVYRKQGDFEKAIRAFIESVDTFRQGGIGDDHPRVQSALVSLAQLRPRTNSPEKEPLHAITREPLTRQASDKTET